MCSSGQFWAMPFVTSPRVQKRSLLWQVFVLDLLFCLETFGLSGSLLCQTAQFAASMNKINEIETMCGRFTLKRLSLDYKICIVTCTDPSSYSPSFPYRRFSEFKYWPQKTSDFSFFFFFLRWLYPDWWYYFINDLALNFALCWHQRWDS